MSLEQTFQNPTPSAQPAPVIRKTRWDRLRESLREAFTFVVCFAHGGLGFTHRPGMGVDRNFCTIDHFVLVL